VAPAGSTDGHRIIATIECGVVRLVSRRGNDATRRFAPAAERLYQLPVRTAIIDGKWQYRTSAAYTHIDHLNAARRAPERLAFFAFDLLWLDGEDLRRCPLLERKVRLVRLLRRGPERLVYSDHWNGDGLALFARIGFYRMPDEKFSLYLVPSRLRMGSAI
jgi:bifunctional non-homologous end joining protein LigD